jgi:hypothetical protein
MPLFLSRRLGTARLQAAKQRPNCCAVCCTRLLQIDVEEKRALVGVEVEVRDRLQGVMAEVVEDRVADRLADAVEAVRAGCLSFVFCVCYCRILLLPPGFSVPSQLGHHLR